MKSFGLYIILMFLVHLGFSQVQFQWLKKYNNDSILETKALTYSTDGYIYIAGTLKFGGSHAWLKKIDDSGRVKLSIYFSKYKQVVPTSIAITPQNQIVLAGYNQAPSEGKTYIWIAKFNQSGKLLWERIFSQFGSSFAVKVLALPNNKLILAANTDPKFTNQYDWLVLKLDSLGFILWSKNFGTPDDDKVNDLSVLKNGYLALAGYYRINKGKRKIAVVNVIDTAGNELFTKFYKFFPLSEATVLTGTRDTGLVVSGFYKSSLDRNNIFVEKLSRIGDSLWAATLPMSHHTMPFSLLQTFDNSTVVAFTLWTGQFPYTDLGVAKFNDKGKLMFLRLLRRGSDEFVGKLIERQDSSVFLLATMYVIDLGWTLGFIRCNSAKSSDLHFITPSKELSTRFSDSLLFKVCLKGYEMPQKIVIYRNSRVIGTVTDIKITGQNDCPFYFERFLPLKFGFNTFWFQVVDYKGHSFRRYRTVLRLPLPWLRQ